MRIAAFYTRKGGTGKSTLSFSFACFAAEKGHRVLLVSTDPQGDSARWAGGGERRLRREDVFESPLGFHAVYSPGRVPVVDDGTFDLLVVDMPPQGEAIRTVKPDIWVSPQDGRNAVLDTLPVVPAMREQGGEILFVLNRSTTAGKRSLDMLRDAVGRIPHTHLYPHAIPDTGPVARVAECSAPPWAVPFGRGSAGSEAVRTLFGRLLRTDLLSLRRATPSPRRRAAGGR